MLKETPYAFYIYMDRRLEIYQSVDQNFHLVGVSKRKAILGNQHASVLNYGKTWRPHQSPCHTRIIVYPKKKTKSGSIGPITDRQGVHPGNRLPVPYRLGAGTQLARHIDRLSAACT